MKTRQRTSVEDLVQMLDSEISNIYSSDDYKRYLNAMSNFHTYSLNNLMLIARQKPDATLIAGYRTWRDKFNRQVKRNEKAIYILAPKIRKIKNSDSDDDDFESAIVGYYAVPVFDISQTIGDDLPTISTPRLLISSVSNYSDFMDAITAIAKFNISFEALEGDKYGYFSNSSGIVIRKGMSESQTIKTAIHELVHSILHSTETSMLKSREIKEAEAESVAYVVCTHFGIDTSDYSFSYITGWLSDGATFKNLLFTVQETAANIISALEDNLKEVNVA